MVRSWDGQCKGFHGKTRLLYGLCLLGGADWSGLGDNPPPSSRRATLFPAQAHGPLAGFFGPLKHFGSGARAAPICPFPPFHAFPR